MPNTQKESLADAVTESFEAVVDRVEHLFSSEPSSVVDAVLQDHEALRNFIGILKDAHRDLRERQRAYRLFSSLLKSHTIAEENAVYTPADKLPKTDVKIKVAEGFVEHKMAEDLMTRMEKLNDPREWGAHANVLAEIVEHHLKEEEDDLLPFIKRLTSAEQDEVMLVQYLDLRQSTQETVRDENAGVLGSIQ